MRRHWQKKPLLIRSALPQFKPLLTRAELFALAGDNDVESRLIERQGKRWTLKHGPLARRSLPPLARPDWTVLVQGVDLHDDRVHGLLQQFRFIPDARLDDLMISYATQGGGVGPHFDSYDVFLLQAQGQRRWRIGRQKNLSLQPHVPLKILAHFEPEEEHALEPGDMLYLPPGWAHDGVALGECMTYSVGFRTPQKNELVREMLERLGDMSSEVVSEVCYADPDQAATPNPAWVPPGLTRFATEALQRLVQNPHLLSCALGEYLSEPKAQVWFEGSDHAPAQGAVVLHRRTRMLYDDAHIFINGESFVVSGRDATLLRTLADARQLSAALRARLSADAQSAVQEWLRAGWLALRA